MPAAYRVGATNTLARSYSPVRSRTVPRNCMPGCINSAGAGMPAFQNPAMRKVASGIRSRINGHTLRQNHIRPSWFGDGTSCTPPTKRKPRRLS